MHILKILILIYCLSYFSISYAGDKLYSTSPLESGMVKENWTELFFHPDDQLNAQVDSVYRLLTPKQRAAQMIMTASSTVEKIGYPYDKAKAMVAGDVAANIVFLKGKSTEFAKQVKELNQLKNVYTTLPPLFACDCEPTLLPYKWTDIKDIKPAAEQKNRKDVEENTTNINKVLKRVGIHLNFAPVADIALNKSVINQRAFGNNPETIAELSTAFIKATQEDGFGATLKHFPGHGAVKGDSHKQSVYIDGKLSELNTFKSIIQSDAPPVAVMAGHIVVRNNNRYDTKGMPASISRTIITDLLRNELKFDGIITTDAMNMVAAAKVSDADWKSVLAGVDLVLMPRDAVLLNKRITEALGKNDALARQLETSIKRIIRLKLLLSY